MAKIDIISGFLGAGKTTLIRKLIADALKGQQVALIENEFGEIGIDGGFLKEAGIEIREMSQGCICCSLVGDFAASLKEVMDTYHPDRILIEPTGVGKLSEIMKAIDDASADADLEQGSAVAVVDASKAKLYIRNFGEFFIDQISYAGTIVLTRVDKVSPEKVQECVALLREHNTKATIITTPISELDGKMILAAMEGTEDLQADLLREVLEAEEEDEDEHEHHHHHHDEDEDEDEHEHHHEGVTDEFGNTVYSAHEHHHHHHHHHGHDADEIFESWGMETPAYYSEQEIRDILAKLEDEETYGIVLRSKGMLPAGDGSWIHFDYVPGEPQTRLGSADVTGKICVIGSGLKEDALLELFRRVK